MTDVPLIGSPGQLAAWRTANCQITRLGQGQARPCESCQQPADTVVDGIVLHLTCPSPAAPRSQPPARGEAAPARRGAPVPSGPAAPAREQRPGGSGERPSAAPADYLAGCLAVDGLWVPGAAAAIKVSWPRSAAEAAALAEKHRLRQLWIHPSAHPALGLPAAKAEGNPQRPEAHPWMEAPGYQCDPPGLAAWVNVRKDGETRRRAIVLAGYETRAAWRAAASGRTLLQAVGELAAVLPKRCSYYYSPNVTSAAIIRRHQSGLAPTRWPLPDGTRIRHVGQWSRVLTDEEEGARWLHRYDVRGQQLAVWNVKLGLGDPVRVAGPTWKPAAKKLAGYWLTEITGGWRPDPLLPDLKIPWRGARGDQIWLPGPYVELLAEVGATFATPEAFLWPDSSAWLETSGKSLRIAREQLEARRSAAGDPADIAGRVVKAMYTSRIGAFSPSEPAKADELVRPDVRDMIISKAFANDYRRMHRIARGRGDAGGSGRWPVAMYADAVYYVSDEPDGIRAAPAGMTIGTGLGEYSHELTLPLADVQDELAGNRFAGAVEQWTRQHAEDSHA